MHKIIRELLTEHSPDLVCIQSVFFNRNITSRILTASVIAIAELANVHACIQSIQVKLQHVKSAVTGSGIATKTAVQKMVNKLLDADIKNGHETDAAAAAIAGLLHRLIVL